MKHLLLLALFCCCPDSKRKEEPKPAHDVLLRCKESACVKFTRPWEVE